MINQINTNGRGEMVRKASRVVVAAAILIVSATLLRPAPAAAADGQNLIDRARITVQAMRQDPSFHATDRLRQARAILIIPELSKGGLLFFGGQGGAGVLMVKRPNGEWSDPAFYSVGGGTFGLQVGFQTAQMVFLVMSDRVAQKWLQNEVKFGTQDGVAVFSEGTQHSDGKTSQGSDVVAWVRANGAYAGITVEGTSISFDRGGNRNYYGREFSATDITLDGRAHKAGADDLRRAASTTAPIRR